MSVAVAFPTEQSPDVGFAVTVTALAPPQTPSVPVPAVFPSMSDPVRVPEATSRMSQDTDQVAEDGAKFPVMAAVLLGVVPAI